jgi:hypothetical protein
LAHAQTAPIEGKYFLGIPLLFPVLMFPITAEGEFRDHVIGSKNIAQNLPSSGNEVGHKDADEGSTTPTTQIADEVLTCWLSTK